MNPLIKSFQTVSNHTLSRSSRERSTCFTSIGKPPMTLAATRAKLEEATRRESAALGLTSSAKRLPPARIIGQGRPDTGAVVGVTDPARTGTSASDSLLKSSAVQLKPLLRLHRELAREGVIELVDAASDLDSRSLASRSLTASPTPLPLAIELPRTGQPLQSSKSSPILKNSPRAPLSMVDGLLERAVTAMHRERLPLRSFAEQREDALRRTLGEIPTAPYTMADVEGLRVSRTRRPGTSGDGAGGGVSWAVAAPLGAMSGAGTVASRPTGVALADEFALRQQQLLSATTLPPPPMSLASQSSSRAGGGRTVPAHVPSTRSEAVSAECCAECCAECHCCALTGPDRPSPTGTFGGATRLSPRAAAGWLGPSVSGARHHVCRGCPPGRQPLRRARRAAAAPTQVYAAVRAHREGGTHGATQDDRGATSLRDESGLRGGACEGLAGRGGERPGETGCPPGGHGAPQDAAGDPLMTIDD